MSEWSPEAIERVAHAIFYSAAWNTWDGHTGRDHWLRRAEYVLDVFPVDVPTLLKAADNAVRAMNEIRPDSDDETWERHGQAADRLEEALEYDIDDHEASNAS